MRELLKAWALHYHRPEQRSEAYKETSYETHFPMFIFKPRYYIILSTSGIFKSCTQKWVQLSNLIILIVLIS